MRSIGVNLDTWVKKGRLDIRAARPSVYGLEFHLATMHREVDAQRPDVVVIDPLSSFTGSASEINATLIRLIDYLKSERVTALFTHLLSGSHPSATDEVGVSSLMDTCILLQSAPPGDGGGRHLSIVKSRGMPHSPERREFAITSRGLVGEDAS